MKDEKIYVVCPQCKKKLFRIDETSDYNNIFVWCKNCKKEIKIVTRAKEPKS